MEERGKRRFIGIDLGKRDYTVAILDEKGKTRVNGGKTNAASRQKLREQLKSSDKVALEAGNLAFIFAREILEKAGSQVVVLNSDKPPLIWSAPTKTDKEDAMKLARVTADVRDERLPIVPVPSKEELERRQHIARYNRIQRERTKDINTPRSLFVHQGITIIKKKDLSNGARRTESVKMLSGRQKDEALWLCKHLEPREAELKILKNEIVKAAKEDENMKRPRTVAGAGPIVSYAYVAHAGDGSRFDNGNQVSNYLGFTPKLDYSGTIERQGHISKRGNGYLRSLLVQSAWIHTRAKNGGALKERFKNMTVTRSMGKKKSIAAVARRMAVLMYALLRNKTEYEARPWNGGGKIAAKLAAEAMSA
jgi:transposase